MFDRYLIVFILAIAACLSPTTAIAENDPERSSSINWESHEQLLDLRSRFKDEADFAQTVMDRALDFDEPMSDLMRHAGLMSAQAYWWNSDQHQLAADCSDAAMRLDTDPQWRMRAAEWSGRSWQRLQHPENAYQSFRTCFELAQQNLEGQITNPNLSQDARDTFITQSREHMGMIGEFMIANAFRSEHEDEALAVVDEISASPTYSEFWKTNALRTAGQWALDHERPELGERYYQTLLDEFPDWGVEDGSRISAHLQLLNARDQSLINCDPEAFEIISTLILDERFQGRLFWLGPISEASKYLEHMGNWRDAISLNLWAIELIEEHIKTLPEKDFTITILSNRIVHQYLMVAQICDRHRNEGMARTACERAMAIETKSEFLISSIQNKLDRLQHFDPITLPLPRLIPITSN